jgi:hypothetical protein
LLIATITFESFMPARCWIAPEIPTAMYSSGATILPVWPTCMSFGTKPASTAARDAPMAAPSLSAMPSSSLKFSPFCMPRPPEITTEAAVSSGRSDSAISWLTKLEIPASCAASTAASSALPPSAATASKAVVRTVITFLASLDCTVAITLPGVDRTLEGIGTLDAMMSLICATSSSAATRGMMFLPLVVAGASTLS